MSVLFLALAGLIAYTLIRPAPAEAPGQIDLSGLNGRYVEDAAYHAVDAFYATTTPLMERIGAKADSDAVAIMKNFVTDTIARFKTDGNFANLTAEDITVMGYDQGRKQSLQILYLISSSPRTLSYIYTIYADTLGAHGNMLFHTFTFDASTGEYLALSDIFTTGPAYLERLSSISRRELPNIIGDGTDAGMIERGTTPEEKNFQNFFFNNGDFILLFPPYQVAAYAAGPQTLRIPVSQLTDILRPEYR